MFFIWTLIIDAALLIGEIRTPAKVIEYFPLLLSRSGRGFLMIFLAFPNVAGEFCTIFLCILICLAGFANIWLGRKNPPVA
jgi:hypothetical protein